MINTDSQRPARGWATAVVFFLFVFFAACSGPPAPADPESPASTVQQRLDPGVAASLAHFEYDLNVPTDWSWLGNGFDSNIQFQLSLDYRLLSLDLVIESPRRFA